MNLTERAISRMKATDKREHFYDDEVTGFGVRVEPGRKSFFWWAKVNGKQVFRALGEFPAVQPGDAREAAKVLAGKASTWKLSGYKAGEDPFEKPKRFVPSGVPTFRELTEAYIENQVRPEANSPEKAEYQVRWMLKKHLAEWLDRKIDTITVDDVLTLKRKCGDKKYLFNRLTEFTRAIFNWSAKSRDGKVNFWRVANPAVDVESYTEKPREKFLQPDEMLRFEEALKTETHVDLKDFLTLALATGARKNDVLSMRWQDIGWDRKVWSVPYPKNGESYDVELLTDALQVLNRRRGQAPEESVFVFPGTGRSGHIADLKKPWNEFRKRAAIPDVRQHDLRRTRGSYAAMSGESLQQIGALLGHKSLQSTAIYAKLSSEAVRETSEAGQRKMKQMMAAAKMRLAKGKKHKLSLVS